MGLEIARRLNKVQRGMRAGDEVGDTTIEGYWDMYASRLVDVAIGRSTDRLGPQLLRGMAVEDSHRASERGTTGTVKLPTAITPATPCHPRHAQNILRTYPVGLSCTAR